MHCKVNVFIGYKRQNTAIFVFYKRQIHKNELPYIYNIVTRRKKFNEKGRKNLVHPIFGVMAPVHTYWGLFSNTMDVSSMISREQLIKRHGLVHDRGVHSWRQSHCGYEHHLYGAHAFVHLAIGKHLYLVSQILLIVGRDTEGGTREFHLAKIVRIGGLALHDKVYLRPAAFVTLATVAIIAIHRVQAQGVHHLRHVLDT